MVHLVGIVAVVTLALLVGMPLLTLVHELGHAFAAAVFVGGRATVVQGAPPFRLRVSVWRLDLRLRGPVGPQQVMLGWALWGANPARWRHAVATAAGPFTSALSAAGCAVTAADLHGLVSLFFALVCGAASLQTLSSGLPVRYGHWFGSFAGEASDGLRVYRLLQGRPEPAPGI